ncbi:predicted protein [Nematostella vectensis]|uniref:N-terminal kinase-like protein n=1 Tax=Nematostella vectensis TaxID=45351 RepID=A7SRT0_NEMVE|nr:predicted protein [Nematostella vectensis]|eukprot:XP_001625668.1 predicted protein [Nematostella vectensis]
MGSGAQNFPYEVGEKLPASESKSPWSVHQGKKKATGQAVTVFALDVKASSDHKIQLAKSAIKRLKTLRHPNIVTYIDSLESDTLIYLVTEPVTPLEIYMADETSIKSDLAISWGIHQIAAGLSFLLNDCNLMHGNICMASIYVDVAGEWKLGGVEYVQPIEPPPGADVTDNSILPALQVYDPPEGRKYSKMNKKLQKWSADVWGLGCLIWEVFNGTLPRPASLKTVGKIPKSLLVHYGELVSANPRIRPNPTKFIENCRASGNYLDNAFVEANLFLSELQIKDPKEQKKFFSSLSSSVDTFPEPFCKHRILPQLINAFEFGAAGSAVLGPLFKVGKLLESEEYEKRIVPCVVKLFSSTDRATRIQLLQQLELFVQHLKPQVVDEQIFPHVALGFGDTVPAMREQTVKAMLLLTPKLSEKTINSHLLKHFAKLQMDQEAGIRTNTTVCLGKIACHLPPATRQKVLVSAFLRPFRDPFPPARTAGVMAFCVTSEFYPLKDVAARILPALCPLTVDPEKKVRDQTFKAVKLFIGKLEKASEDPESAMNTAADQSTADGSASSWTGWAVTSLTSKLYRGGAPAAAGAPGSATPPAEQAGPPPATGKPGTIRPGTKTQGTAKKTQNDGGGFGGGNWDTSDWGSLESSVQDPPPSHASAGGRDDGGWDTGDWGSMDAVSTGGPSKAELAKQKREERKQQRLLAMKEKRAAKGPSKLGGVKIQ